MPKASQKYNLQVMKPSLASEWHPIKNSSLKPFHVTPSSNKKVWWICSRGHEWATSVRVRNRGTGCPYCSGRLATEDTCLEAINPHLAREWHLTKNDTLTPKDITAFSHKRVWWICGKGHEWQASVGHRTYGTGCPYCAGKLACDDNCLQTLNPKLAKEWHPTRNGKLRPKDVTVGRNKKVWWICDSGHEWEASIANRNRGARCPYCSGKLVSDENCLQNTNPVLVIEWHYTKNGRLTPKAVSSGSHKMVWWTCKRGHEWQAAVFSRSKGVGCPYCAGQKVCDDNCLETVSPKLAKEWHPTKNGKVTPKDVTAGSSKKVWWICNKGHEWEALVVKRSQGRGCPYCSGRRRLDEGFV